MSRVDAMASPFETLGFGPAVVRRFNSADLLELSRRSARALMSVLHPDVGGDVEAFGRVRDALNDILNGDIRELKERFFAGETQDGRIEEKKADLQRARIMLEVAARGTVVKPPGQEATMAIHRAGEWARSFFSDGVGGQFVFNGRNVRGLHLRQVFGTEIGVRANEQKKSYLQSRVKRLDQDIAGLKLALSGVDIGAIDREIKSLEKKRDRTPEDKLWEIMEGIGKKLDEKKDYQKNRRRLKKFIEGRKAAAEQLADGEAFIKRYLVGEDGVVDAGGRQLKLLGCSKYIKPTFLSEVEPQVHMGGNVICLAEDGSLVPLGRVAAHREIGGRPAGIAPQEIVDRWIDGESDVTDLTVVEPSRQEKRRNPFSVLGLAPSVMLELKRHGGKGFGGEHGAERKFVAAYGKALLAMLVRNGPVGNFEAGDVSAALAEIKQDDAFGRRLAEFLHESSHDGVLGELDALISKTMEDARETGIANASRDLKKRPLAKMAPAAEGYIGILLESVYGEATYAPGLANAPLLHKSHGVELTLSTGEGEVRCVLERRGADIWIEADGETHRVFGSTFPSKQMIPEADGRNTEPINIADAFLFARPAIITGGELLVTSQDQLFSAGRIEKASVPPVGAHGDYKTVMARMMEAARKMAGGVRGKSFQGRPLRVL